MSVVQRLLAGAPVVTDGAWGTELQALGLPAGECPDLWNLSRPECVEAVARSYVDAGSQVILTNTFRGTRFNIGERVAEVNRAGVEISRRAAAGRAAVFGSLGPSGKMLLAAEVNEDELSDAFAQQADALRAADAIVIETMTDLTEARLAIAAARQTRLPVVACMVFDVGRNKDRTMMGATPEQCARELSDAGADVIGANCGRGIAGYVEICRRLGVAGRPVWIKPNAGIPELVDGRAVYRTTPEEFASYVPALVEAGASFVGGCCGTTPDFIRAVRERVATCVSS